MPKWQQEGHFERFLQIVKGDAISIFFSEMRIMIVERGGGGGGGFMIASKGI